MSIANDLGDQFIRHSVDLMRLEASERRIILKMLKGLEHDIVTKLLKTEGLTLAETRRMEALFVAVEETIRTAYTKIATQQRAALIKIGEFEVEQTQDIVNRTVGAALMTVGVPLATIKAMVDGDTVLGVPAKDWWAKQGPLLKARFQDTMRRGVFAGESLNDLTRRVRGTRESGFTDGLMMTSTRNAEALIRTSVQSILGAARDATLRANDDVLAGQQWLSTLDSRTCFASGSPVILASGGTASIESITPGQWVISGRGIPRRVKAVKRAWATDWRQITFADGRRVTCTATHPFWTRQGWREASRLQTGIRVGVRPLSSIVYATAQRTTKRHDENSQVLLSCMLPSSCRAVASTEHAAMDMPSVRKSVRQSPKRESSSTVLFEGMRLPVTANINSLRSLQEGSITSSWYPTAVLLQGLLPLGDICHLPQAHMPLLQKAVSGTSDLCRKDFGLRENVLRSMPNCAQSEGIRVNRFDICVRTMRGQLYSKTRASYASTQEGSSLTLLLDGMSEGEVSMQVPHLHEDIRVKDAARQVLLQAVLCKQHSSNGDGRYGCGRTQGTRTRVCIGSADRKDESRLSCAKPQLCYRSRRSLLARENINEGSTEESHCGTGWLDHDQSHRGLSDCGYSSVSRSGARPMPQGWSEIAHIERVHGGAECFDLEVEGDHSFLVTESGLIVHNSDICIALSGQAWDFEGNPLGDTTQPFPGPPPAHWGCRSGLVPLLKSWEQLAKDAHGDEKLARKMDRVERTIDPGTQASMDGQIPSDVDYSTWLKGRSVTEQKSILGPGKWALWKKGKIGLTDLVDQRGMPRTLEQLQAVS